MVMMLKLNYWLIYWAATSAAVIVSYFWLDRPIARLVAGHLHRQHGGFFSFLTHFPDPLIPTALIVIIVLGLRTLAGTSSADNPLLRLKSAIVVCSISVILTEAIKDELKFIFGRTWPETWIRGNPSFIRDGVYGFNFLHGGVGYQSFPSGHMALACAVFAVLWIWYPKLRFAYLIITALIAVLLIAGNYHFLSDVIAGAFVGISTALLTIVIWNAYFPTRAAHSK